MTSSAGVYKDKNVGVILTGMGSDGARGIKAIKEKGGFTIAQDEKTSVVYGMPKAAFDLGYVDAVVPLDLIPKEIIKACN
jgi:two-component system chemotaxis response regulator CheB